MPRLRNWSVSPSGATLTLVGVDHDTGAKRRISIRSVALTPRGVVARDCTDREIELLTVFRHEVAA